MSVKRKNSTFGNILINFYILNHTSEGRPPTTYLPPPLLLLVPWFDLAVCLPTVAQEQILSRQGQGFVNHDPSARSTAHSYSLSKLRSLFYYSIIGRMKCFVTHEGGMKQNASVCKWSTLKTLIQTHLLTLCLWLPSHCWRSWILETDHMANRA